MNTSFLRVLEKTMTAMMGANPLGYLSTQLELIQGNLSTWEDVDVCTKTISRGLHILNDKKRLDVQAVPVKDGHGGFCGKRLIIKATGLLHAYAKVALHTFKRFVHRAERTAKSFEPILKNKVLSSDYPTFTQYILSDVPFWDDPASLKGFQAFKDYLGRL